MPAFPKRVLVANRGEIARRVIATARRLGVETVAVHHPIDADLPFVAEADRAVAIEAEVPVRAYLDRDRIVDVALETGATAIHPGYGFLSENAGFARQVEESGLTWIGPQPEVIALMGDKIAARAAVAAAGVPVGVGGEEALGSAEEAAAEAERIGYPVMVKAAEGGGGIGMTVVDNAGELSKALDSTRSMAMRSFGSGRVFLERFVSSARHVEVQVLGLADGTVLALGERDCSVQRRHQKLLEESPAPHLDPAIRNGLREAAIRAAESVGYRNAGTVEFLVDTRTGEYVFLEMNTRIQVEHPVTEMTYGIDLVEQQFSIAATGSTSANFAPRLSGHAVELRVCAEDPKRFLPTPGHIMTWVEPQGPGIRVDSGYRSGDDVTMHFDSLVAKLCVFGDTRDQALARAREAAKAFEVTGLITNLPFLQKLLDLPEFVSGRYDTNVVSKLATR